MDDARAQRTATLTRARKLKFPLDTKNTPYEAKIKFTAREVESFDVNFLFDLQDNEQLILLSLLEMN